ncbi:MAG TPA: ABC transporter ATP-binding protein [Patescibacteria group bacterium]
MSKKKYSYFRNIGRVIGLNWEVRRWMFLFEIGLNLVQGIVPLLSAYFSGRVLALLATASTGTVVSTSLILNYVVATAAILLFERLSNYFYNYLDDYNSIEFNIVTQRRLMEKFLSLDFTYYEDSGFNDTLEKIDQNRHVISRVTTQLMSLFRNSVQIISSGFAIATLNPWTMAVVAISLIPNLYFELAASLERWKQWRSKGVNIRKTSMIRSNILNSDKVGEIKVFGLENYFLDLWNTYVRKFRGEEVELERKVTRNRSLSSIFEQSAETGIDIWLVLKVLRSAGTFGIGDFQFYRSVIRNFSGACSGFMMSIQGIQERMLYVNDYFSFFELEPRLKAIDTTIVLPDTVPSIEFHNVSFAYPGTEKNVLENFNLVINPGESVALVGKNGAGKSTFVKLLMRFYDVSSGEILINGINIKEVNLQSWYTHVGILFQDFSRFEFLNAKETIEIGRTKVKNRDERLEQSIQYSQAHEVISKLPKGLEQTLTKALPEGVGLSGGQWQRLALARAFYRHAAVLIMDEPTSALDAQAEYNIFQQLNEHQKGKTTLFISHRFSTVRNADKIVVVADGKIEEQGTHKALMQIPDGTYHRMYQLQAKSYQDTEPEELLTE